MTDPAQSPRLAPGDLLPEGVTLAEIIAVLEDASNALLDADCDLMSEEVDGLLKRLKGEPHG